MAELKPPLGVSPAWFVYPQRIKELHAAMGRYIEHAEKCRFAKSNVNNYNIIAKWAREIECLALLTAKQEEIERRVNDNG